MLYYFLLDLHVPLHAPISNRGACFLVRLVTKISVQEDTDQRWALKRETVGLYGFTEPLVVSNFLVFALNRIGK